MPDKDAALRQQLIELMRGGNAHISFDEAIENFPPELRGNRPEGAQHSPWEELEHMRIAQWDILEFSRDPDHTSPEFPKGYWPNTPAPPSDEAWEHAIRMYRADLQSMCALIADGSSDLYARIPHGAGQTLLREALLVADHNAYHLGQLVLLRRMLGAWKKE